MSYELFTYIFDKNSWEYILIQNNKTASCNKHSKNIWYDIENSANTEEVYFTRTYVMQHTKTRLFLLK